VLNAYMDVFSGAATTIIVAAMVASYMGSPPMPTTTVAA